MTSGIIQRVDGGVSDQPIHDKLLSAVNFKKTKAFEKSKKKAEALGLSADQVTQVLGD